MPALIRKCRATLLIAILLFMIAATISIAPSGRTLFAGPTQQESQKNQDLLPHADLYTPEEISKNFGLQQFKPFANEKLFFEILVPTGWVARPSEVEPEQLSHDNESPVSMADLGPGGADDVGLNVLYMRVPAATALDRFMDTYIQKSGGTVVARQHAEFKGRAVEDALLKTNWEDLGAVLIRATASRQGDFIFIVSGFSVEGKYDQYKRAFGAVAVSFNPLSK